MEIQVRRLRDALEMLTPAVPRNPTLPVLTHVRLGDGRAAATDLEVAASVEMSEADETLLLPHKAALEFLRFTPGPKVAVITPTRGKVSIAVDGVETAFEVADPIDSPPIPDSGGEHEGVLDGDALLKALTAVLPYTAHEETRPVLSGVHLATGDTVEAVGADGFRLAWETIPGELAGPPMNIPRKAIAALGHLWKRGAAPEVGHARDIVGVVLAKRLIRLDWGGERLRMRFGKVTLVTHLTQGTFPNYSSLGPTETDPGVTVHAEDMQRALRQVQPMAYDKDSKGLVRLVWEEERLILSTKAAEVGEVSVPIPARSAASGRIALNIRYLLEYFLCKTGVVTFAPNKDSATGPVLFSHRGTPHVLIMPIHTVW
ncbi:MAG: DNA polymerase III subunit beta [Chloroflexota bacterium]